MYCTHASGISDKDVECNPPIRKGHRESAWVTTIGKGIGEVKRGFKWKMRHCYGIEMSEVKIHDGSQFETK